MLFLLFICCGFSIYSFGQVSINTDGSSPAAGTVLEVKADKVGSDSTFAITDGGKLVIGATSSDASAIVDLNSNDAGILIPRLTEAQRDAISSPERVY